jgi:protoporphyrinogen oxidase
MLQNKTEIIKLSREIGKPIVCIYNHIETKWYYYVSDDWKPVNLANQIYTNLLTGKYVNDILLNVQNKTVQELIQVIDNKEREVINFPNTFETIIFK